jgi:hypothetical protein
MGHRLEVFINTLPLSMSNAFDNYYSEVEWKKSSKTKNPNIPFWILLPYALSEYYAKKDNSDEKERNIINEIIWAQFCIFLFIRIKDDVLDAGTDIYLSLIADQFLIESEKSFYKYFQKSKTFWSLYHMMLRESTIAMYQKEKFQKDIYSATNDIKNCIIEEGAILNLGIAAVCCRFGKRRDFSKLRNITSHLTVASQLIDDLIDVEEDLNIGNYNYVLRRLIHYDNFTNSSNNEIIEKFNENMVFDNGFVKLTEEISNHLNQAETILSQYGFNKIMDYISDHRNLLSSLKREIHDTIFEYYFGNQVKLNSKGYK